MIVSNLGFRVSSYNLKDFTEQVRIIYLSFTKKSESILTIYKITLVIKSLQMIMKYNYKKGNKGNTERGSNLYRN